MVKCVFSASFNIRVMQRNSIRFEITWNHENVGPTYREKKVFGRRAVLSSDLAQLYLQESLWHRCLESGLLHAQHSFNEECHLQKIISSESRLWIEAGKHRVVWRIAQWVEELKNCKWLSSSNGPMLWSATSRKWAQELLGSLRRRKCGLRVEDTSADIAYPAMHGERPLAVVHTNWGSMWHVARCRL